MADRQKACSWDTSQSGERPAGGGAVAGQRADERLPERADAGGGHQVGVGHPAGLAQRGREHVGVGPAEDQPLGLDRRVDRLGQQRVRALRRGERAADEHLDRAGDPGLGDGDAHGIDLGLGGAPEHLGEQVRLRREVAVHAAGGDPGAGRDHADGRGRVAAVGELRDGSSHDPLALGLAARVRSVGL